MYDINFSNLKGLRKLYLILFVICFIFSMIFICNSFNLNRLDHSVLSIRVNSGEFVNDNGQTMYSPSYYYIVNGVEYICKSNFSRNWNPGTDNMRIYYDLQNPSNCFIEESKTDILIFLSPFILISIFLVILVIKVNYKISKVKKLSHNWKLVKHLPFIFEPTSIALNGHGIDRVVIDYVLPDGSVIKLRSDLIMDNLFYCFETVDLLIDENNIKNYFIDYNINRVGGNLPDDYANPEGYPNIIDYILKENSNIENDIEKIDSTGEEDFCYKARSNDKN